jgi:uncharacterized membrane protein
VDEIAIARALHVLSIVLWIGGVAFVTTVLIPAIRRLRAPNDRLALFDAIERRFAWSIAKIAKPTGSKLTHWFRLLALLFSLFAAVGGSGGNLLISYVMIVLIS